MTMEIEIVFHGEVVRGVITHRSATDLAIVTTSPHPGLEASAHRMSQALVAGDLLGDAGDALAAGMLQELHQFARAALQRRGSLAARLGKYRASLEILGARRAGLQSAKQAARGEFRGKSIDQPTYQRRLRALEGDLADAFDEERAVEDKLFSGIAKDMPYHQRPNAIKWLECLLAAQGGVS